MQPVAACTFLDLVRNLTAKLPIRSVSVLFLSALFLPTITQAGPQGEAPKPLLATDEILVTGDFTTNPPVPMNPFNLVGICPIPSHGRTWSVVWHFDIEGIDPLSSIRVQKYLEGPDVTDCLAQLIESDSVTRAKADLLEPGVKLEDAVSATDAVYERWRSVNVDKAILEVMTTGARGEQVAALLASCQRLSTTR